MIASFADPGQKTAPAPFGHALATLAEERPEIVGLSADLAKYTDMHIFRDAHPDRFFQMGMAEQAMLGAAAGMAEVGLVPFASTYSVFATRRAYDFLCLDIAEPNLNVNVVGALPGLTTGYGPSHQATEDLAILRGCPNLTIVDPCDSVDIEQAVPQLAAHDGPTYLRLLRGQVPTVLDEYGYRFQLGKAAELRTGRDVVLISTGLMTMRALQAAARLEADHVDVAVLHVPTIKPLDREAILRAARDRPARGDAGEPHRDRRAGRVGRVDAGLRGGRHADRAGRAARRVPRRRRAAHPARPLRAVHRLDRQPRQGRAERAARAGRADAGRRPQAQQVAHTSRMRHRSRPARRPLPPPQENPMSVSDFTAVVTGAGSTRGIGRATAHALAAAGWNVAILDLDEAGAKDAADEIAEQHGVQAVGVGCDVTDDASVEAALATVAGAVPPVGALVNNAGITSPTPFLEVTARGVGAHVRRQRARLLQRHPPLAPGMVERGFGRIVFLSSVSAERGGGVFGGVAYSAAKAAQLGFARALARELGPNGVTVNSVAPGLIDTDITAGKLVGEKEKQVLAGIPVGRKGARRRRRRPDHLPVPRGVRLHHRRHVRRERRGAHPLTVQHDGGRPTSVHGSAAPSCTIIATTAPEQRVMRSPTASARPTSELARGDR